MGGHGHVEVPKVPDYKIYRVEDVPQLVKMQKALASQGLRDPWARNYVWKYTEEINHPVRSKSVFWVFKYGFKYGLAAAVLTTIVEKAYLKYHYGDDAHH